MILIKSKDQTFDTFYIRNSEDNTEYEFYKHLDSNYKYKIKLLSKILNIPIDELENYIQFEEFDYIPSSSPSFFGKNNTYKNEWNFLIHSTKISYLNKIFKDGYIKAFSIGDKWFGGKLEKTKDISKVYTHFLFSDLFYNGKAWNFNSNSYGSCVLVLSMDILKKEDYIVCDSMSFGSCVTDKKEQINIKSNINILKNHINSQIETKSRMSKKIDKNVYIYSHEIVFDKIDLKYLVAIIAKSPNYNEVCDLVEKYNLNHIKVLKYSSDYKKVFSKINN